MARKKSSNSPPQQSPPTWDENLINWLLPYRAEIAGVFIALAAAITILGHLGLTQSALLNIWTSFLWEFMGWGNYPLFLSIMAGGIYFALSKINVTPQTSATGAETTPQPRPFQLRIHHIIGYELILLASLPLSHQLTKSTLADAHLGRGGGLVGWALSEPLVDFLGPAVTAVLYITLLLYGATHLFGISWENVYDGLNKLSLNLQSFSTKIAPNQDTIVTFGGTVTTLGEGVVTETANGETAVSPAPTRATNNNDDELVIIDDSAVDGRSTSRRRSRKLPPMSILDKGGNVALSPAEIDSKKAIIEKTLEDFGLPAQVTEIQRGPAVTQFGVEPGYIERTGPDGVTKKQKVRVNKIAALQRDLAMALTVERLRIEAPVPGRSVVGIEVPNAEVNIVRMRSIVESDGYHKLKSPMAAALGRNVSGTPISIDLAKMPHLLIAGTTGSGKSICMNALIGCLVFNNTPDKLKIIMIDPKKVELIRFNGMPHLIGSVETEADRAVGVLRWLTAEMDRRYELFAAVGARNLNGYNRKAASREGLKKIPYMGVFIDELADLMLTYPGDVERTLCRLAQMARATGIHLVVATQRPSTDVITGLIKANFPARISFAVASGIDSRVILDSVGAENLLGKGDMLFLSPESGEPERVQGVFVSDNEVEGIVKHWRDKMPDFEPQPPPWDNLIARYAHLDKTDTLLEAAIELTKKYDEISTSMLQRRLRLGYPRAARIMEHLFEMGLVADPKEGGKTRKTLVGDDDVDPLGDFLADRE